MEGVKSKDIVKKVEILYEKGTFKQIGSFENKKWIAKSKVLKAIERIKDRLNLSASDRVHVFSVIDEEVYGKKFLEGK